MYVSYNNSDLGFQAKLKGELAKKVPRVTSQVFKCYTKCTCPHGAMMMEKNTTLACYTYDKFGKKWIASFAGKIWYSDLTNVIRDSWVRPIEAGQKLAKFYNEMVK